MSPEITTISMGVTIACIIAACLSLLAGYRLMKPLPVKVSARSTARPFTGFLLLTSTVAWTLVGINAQKTTETTVSQIVSFEDIEQLPATAAGIPPSFDEFETSATALPEAKVVVEAEEIAEEPRSPDFQKLRDHVTNMLFSAEGFKTTEEAILIDLSQDSHREMIKYIADERPGLLTVIYHKQLDSGPRMVVYFPEIAGNQLIYTPLTGPASSALSKVIKQNSMN